MITTADLQWAAGFLEGEGCWPRSNAIGVVCGQVQRWPLEKLQALFGGSINKRPKSKNPNAQEAYMWSLYGWRGAGLSMTLYPLMSPKRQERIREALLRWIPKPVDCSMRTLCPRGHPYRNDGKGRSHRRCVECIRVRVREQYRRKHAPHLIGMPRRTAGARVTVP